MGKKSILAKSCCNRIVLKGTKVKRSAFTMAEILISLTIIGIIAAITLPSLVGNINEKTWTAQRKALYGRMSQAIALMPSLNGYGLYATEDDTTANAAQEFVTKGLAKVLKINNICDNNHLTDCGVPKKFKTMVNSTLYFASASGVNNSNIITTLYKLNNKFQNTTYNGTTFSTTDTNAAAFETQNGESLVAFYNPTCRVEYLNEATPDQNGNLYGFPEATMCVNFIYDLNGKKGPNKVGKDMGFITVFNSTDSIVLAPMPSSNKNVGEGTIGSTYTWQNVLHICKNEDPNSRIPNIDEMSAMFINGRIIGLSAIPSGYWSSTLSNNSSVWNIYQYSGVRLRYNKSFRNYVRCIKR